jgi:hypothetical protein
VRGVIQECGGKSVRRPPPSPNHCNRPENRRADCNGRSCPPAPGEPHTLPQTHPHCPLIEKQSGAYDTHTISLQWRVRRILKKISHRFSSRTSNTKLKNKAGREEGFRFTDTIDVRIAAVSPALCALSCPKWKYGDKLEATCLLGSFLCSP